VKQTFGTSHRHHRERKHLHTLSFYISAPHTNERKTNSQSWRKGRFHASCLTTACLVFSDLPIARGFPIMESIRVTVVNSATVNCFVERRNGDGEGREIVVETWRSIKGRGTSGRQRMLPPGLDRFGCLAGTLFRALLAHHPIMLQSSHSIHDQDITILRCLMFKYKNSLA